MANCHNLFQTFNQDITLTTARKKSLKKSRKSLRDKIRTYFDEEKPSEIKPKFWTQGSFEMNVSVNPIPRKVMVEGEECTLCKYDVDDGVYFIGDENKAQRKSIQTYHNWIYEAVKNHTATPPKGKHTCVRVLFSDGHNIDLPIYYKKGGIPELAHRQKGWIESDPQAFIQWFNGLAAAGDQLRRMVKYLKAWCDFINFQDGTKKMPSGVIMTIWAAENWILNERDDIAIRDLLQRLKNRLDIWFRCDRPTTPAGENLLEDYEYKDYFMKHLNAFLNSGKSAIEDSNQKEACLKWQKHFGSRFPCWLANDEEENAKAFAAPTVINRNAKSA